MSTSDRRTRLRGLVLATAVRAGEPAPGFVSRNTAAREALLSGPR